MRSIQKLDFIEPFKLVCHFDNGEKRLLDLTKSLNGPKKYTSKILNKNEYKKAKIGSIGQIYWENMAEMKDLNGKTIPCEYDICPDYAYLESEPIEQGNKTTTNKVLR